MYNADKLAYPSHYALDQTEGVKETDPRTRVSGGGLTKRERFAMAAMQGLLAGDKKRLPGETVVKQAVYEADALLKELED